MSNSEYTPVMPNICDPEIKPRREQSMHSMHEDVIDNSANSPIEAPPSLEVDKPKVNIFSKIFTIKNIIILIAVIVVLFLLYQVYLYLNPAVKNTISPQPYYMPSVDKPDDASVQEESFENTIDKEELLKAREFARNRKRVTFDLPESVPEDQSERAPENIPEDQSEDFSEDNVKEMPRFEEIINDSDNNESQGTTYNEQPVDRQDIPQVNEQPVNIPQVNEQPVDRQGNEQVSEQVDEDDYDPRFDKIMDSRFAGAYNNDYDEYDNKSYITKDDLVAKVEEIDPVDTILNNI
jgi:hypothetical protein